MARRPKPWWRSQTGEYCVTIDGTRHRLGPDKEAAETKFHELMAKPEKRLPSNTIKAIMDLFLDWCQRNNKPLTYDFYRKHLQGFVDTIPALLTVKELKPHHVESWISEHDWGPSYQRGAMTAVARAFNWAFKKGHIDHNPIWKRLDKPTAKTRQVVISPAQFKKLLVCLKGDFRDLAITAWETGCRPQEATKVEARHVDLRNARWVFPEEESKGKTRKRVVYLSKQALAITKRLVAKRPSGPLFLHGDKPWDRFSVANQFRRLKKRIGVHYRLYDFRFSFCTNGLKKGVDPITMQHLMGHKDLQMISKIYALVSQDVRHMRRSAELASR